MTVTQSERLSTNLFRIDPLEMGELDLSNTVLQGFKRRYGESLGLPELRTLGHLVNENYGMTVVELRDRVGVTQDSLQMLVDTGLIEMTRDMFVTTRKGRDAISWRHPKLEAAIGLFSYFQEGPFTPAHIEYFGATYGLSERQSRMLASLLKRNGCVRELDDGTYAVSDIGIGMMRTKRWPKRGEQRPVIEDSHPIEESSYDGKPRSLSTELEELDGIGRRKIEDVHDRGSSSADGKQIYPNGPKAKSRPPSDTPYSPKIGLPLTRKPQPELTFLERLRTYPELREVTGILGTLYYQDGLREVIEYMAGDRLAGNLELLIRLARATKQVPDEYLSAFLEAMKTLPREDSVARHSTVLTLAETGKYGALVELSDGAFDQTRYDKLVDRNLASNTYR